jgi:hypothetical protein
MHLQKRARNPKSFFAKSCQPIAGSQKELLMIPDHHFTAHLEAFGEPRTIPDGWDLSGIYAPRPTSDGSGPAPDPEPRLPSQPQTPASPESFSRVDSFPPRWDLSSLV